MLYPFMTLNDDTEITHSEMRAKKRSKYGLKNLYMAVFILLPAGFLSTNGKMSKDFHKKIFIIFRNC